MREFVEVWGKERDSKNVELLMKIPKEQWNADFGRELKKDMESQGTTNIEFKEVQEE